MSKGFQLFTTTVTNPVFAEYILKFQPWIVSGGSSAFTKDLDRQMIEGDQLAVIIELHPRKLRWANSINNNMSNDVTH